MKNQEPPFFLKYFSYFVASIQLVESESENAVSNSNLKKPFMKKQFLFVVAGLMMATFTFAQNGVEGRWKTIDDETGKMKSIVEISIKNGKLYGKIVELKPGEDPNKICKACTDYRKGKKLVGMDIITGLSKDGDAWEGDDGIMDPENGKSYDCKLWAEGGKLQVRGYIGFVFRTQTWVRP